MTRTEAIDKACRKMMVYSMNNNFLMRKMAISPDYLNAYEKGSILGSIRAQYQRIVAST